MYAVGKAKRLAAREHPGAETHNDYEQQRQLVGVQASILATREACPTLEDPAAWENIWTQHRDQREHSKPVWEGTAPGVLAVAVKIEPEGPWVPLAQAQEHADFGVGR